MSDPINAQYPDDITSELLRACEAQHEAIDRLFAMLIGNHTGFLPSHSGQPWTALLMGHAAITKAKQNNIVATLQPTITTERITETLAGIAVILLRTLDIKRRIPPLPLLHVWQDNNVSYGCWADDTSKQFNLLPFFCHQTVLFGEFRYDEAMMLANTLASLLCLGVLPLDVMDPIRVQIGKP
jgi:hypothetical protein